MLINRHQLDNLLGFYTHCFCVYHDKVKSDFAFWANQLDDINVPWSVQNTVAVLAESKGNQRFYFRTLLKQKGITVQ